MALVLERKEQKDKTSTGPGVMLTPPINEQYWKYRVALDNDIHDQINHHLRCIKDLVNHARYRIATPDLARYEYGDPRFKKPKAGGAMKKKAKATLEYSKGSNEGSAIYLMLHDENGNNMGGTRIAGPKCWGLVRAIESFSLDESDLKRLIKECEVGIKFIREHNGTIEQLSAT